jgi:hypothetical protein
VAYRGVAYRGVACRGMVRNMTGREGWGACDCLLTDGSVVKNSSPEHPHECADSGGSSEVIEQALCTLVELRALPLMPSSK